MNDFESLIQYTIVGFVLLTTVVFVVYLGSELLTPVHTETGTTATLPEQMFGPVVLGMFVIGIILVARQFWGSTQEQGITR